MIFFIELVKIILLFFCLNRNLIDDIKQLEFLNLCPKLENLTICGNPICSKPSPDAQDNVL